MSIRLTGATGSAPFLFDTAATSITGDIDLRVLLSMDNWVPAAASTLIAKDTTSNRSFNFYIDTAGKPSLFLTANGASGPTATASVATGFAAKTKHWVRATWSNSGDLAKFYDAPGNLKDPVAADFTQMGTDQAAASTGIFDGTALVEIGSCFGTTLLNLTNANVYRAQIRNGIDGTLVADFDPSVLKVTGRERPNSFIDKTGQTWLVGFGTTWDWSTA